MRFNFVVYCFIFLIFTLALSKEIRIDDDANTLSMSNEKINAIFVNPIPITYYTSEQINLSPMPGLIEYAQLIQCNKSRAGYPYVVIWIIQPDNPNFLINHAYTVMEISRCPTSWSSDCIVGTNYVSYNGVMEAIYNNITLLYNDSQTTLYLRFQSKLGSLPVTIRVTYDNDAETFNGRFDSNVFSNINPGGNWYFFDQLAQTYEVGAVETYASYYYFINFCDAAIYGDYVLSITVTSDPTTPLAGFDLAGCSASMVSVQNCQPYNNNLKGVVASQTAATVATVEMYSSVISLENGIFINVFGFGGEIDGENVYLVTVTESPV